MLSPHVYPFVERSVLHPAVTIDEQYQAFEEVTRLGLAGLTVAPFWVKKFRRDLGEVNSVSLNTVVGYPYGYQRTEAKQTEVEWALKDGASNVEVVVNTSALYSPASVWQKVELAKLVSLIHAQERLFTVVLESSLLDETLVRKMIKIAADAGADFIKNATGAVQTDFLLNDAIQFRQWVPASVGVKIIGDGATPDELSRLIDEGVERLVLAHPLESG
mgnify:CR=1 FL=1